LGNGWGSVTPWGLSNPVTTYFPPDGNTFFTNTSRYITDYIEVLGKGRDVYDDSIGNTNPTLRRTPIETYIGTFFDNDNFGTSLPPGQYLAAAQQIGVDQGLSRGNYTRMLALTALSLANANIGAWAVKYEFQEWRPVAGIRAAGSDPFPQTVQDLAWLPVSVTSPPFPDYVSGHGTFGFSFAQIMRRFFKTDFVKFTLYSDNMPTISSTYNRLSDFALDNALSRIFLGCHFRAAALDTQLLGEPMVNDVADHQLLPL